MPIAEAVDRAEFDALLRGVVDPLRGALTELLASVQADATSPTLVARRLGINKNLAWQVCGIIGATEPGALMERLPGRQGIDIFLAAAADKRASADSIAAVREALAELGRVVETHAGDRRTLGLMLASHHEARSEPVEESRRLAFDGNSAIWGLQCRVRLSSFFVAPNETDASMIDYAFFGGYVGVRRLRPTASAPLLLVKSYNDDGSSRDPVREPLDGDEASKAAPGVVGRFCTEGAAPLRIRQTGDQLRLELPPGPVGNTSLTTWIFGWRLRRSATRYRDAVNRFAEYGTRNFLPTEALVADVFVHRAFVRNPTVQAAMYSELAGQMYPGIDGVNDELPLREPVTPLAGTPPIIATPLLARYSEWVRWAFDRLGWDAREFNAFRLVVKYPPVATIVVVRHDLPDRPGDGG